MSQIKFNCSYCGRSGVKHISHYHWSIKQGLNQYCDRKCAGLGRRTNETKEEKRSIKGWYDQFLKISMTDEARELKALQRMVYFQWEYARSQEKHRKRRQKRMAAHVEYCRQSEYKKWKKWYDEQYRAKKNFGDYWECAIALKNLDSEIDYRESKRQNKIYNKSTTKRKRAWRKTLKQNLKNLQQLI